MKVVQSLVTLFSAFSLGVFASTTRGPDTYVRVLFGNNDVVYYNFGECYPFQLDNGNGPIAQYAQWYQSTDCQSYRSYDCTGEKVLNLPVPLGTPLINVADFAQLLAGNSANCTKLELNL